MIILSRPWRRRGPQEEQRKRKLKGRVGYEAKDLPGEIQIQQRQAPGELKGPVDFELCNYEDTRQLTK